MSQEKLKPCPFCGSSDDLVLSYKEKSESEFILCNSCGAEGPCNSDVFDSRNGNIKWNNRTGDPQ